MPASFHDLFAQALQHRKPLIDSKRTQAFRAFSGIADGIDGVFVDVYGEGAVLIVYEGRPPKSFDEKNAADAILEQLKSIGVRAIYHKPFVKDRSRMGGELPPVVTDQAPLVGEALPEAILIKESSWNLEIRLWDGLSTGLFLDQRENRIFVSNWCKQRFASSKQKPAVLNTFAYTCAFSIAAAVGGAATTSVDVSGRYLDWGKRSFGHNQINTADHWFAKMDTFEFFGYAGRKGLKYDMIILDPPSFASGSKKKGIKAWSSVADYARLVREAAQLLKPRGMLFASTNTQELCQPGRLEREVGKGLGREPRWLDLPEAPIDFAREQDRFAAVALAV